MWPGAVLITLSGPRVINKATGNGFPDGGRRTDGPGRTPFFGGHGHLGKKVEHPGVKVKVRNRSSCSLEAAVLRYGVVWCVWQMVLQNLLGKGLLPEQKPVGHQ